MRVDRIPESRFFEELGRAAEHFGYLEFTKGDFDKFASMSASTLILTIFCHFRAADKAHLITYKPFVANVISGRATQT